MTKVFDSISFVGHSESESVFTLDGHNEKLRKLPMHDAFVMQASTIHSENAIRAYQQKPKTINE
jgi:hypothetical protein